MKSIIGTNKTTALLLGAKPISQDAAVMSSINDAEQEKVVYRTKSDGMAGVPGEKPAKRRSACGFSRIFRRNAYKYYLNKFPAKKFASEPNLAQDFQAEQPKVQVKGENRENDKTVLSNRL